MLRFSMLYLFTYVEFTTLNTSYTTSNIFPTSSKNLNRTLYVNLENSHFMLTTTTHLVRLQNESSDPQKVTTTQLFQYFVVWDKNTNKTNNDIWEANFNIWETAVREQVHTWHVSHFFFFFSNKNNNLKGNIESESCVWIWTGVSYCLTKPSFFRNILVDYDFRMRKKPGKFINLQHIYAVMFIPALSWGCSRAGNSVISQKKYAWYI